MLKEDISKLTEGSIKSLQRKKELPAFKAPEILVEKPRDKSRGDYSTSIALQIAKIVKKNPMEVAGLIESEMNKFRLQASKNYQSGIFEKTEIAKPGFINFLINKKELEKLFSEYLKRGPKFFRKKPDKKETIVVEYSSPNIAKPLGVHHLRSTIIGQALVDILRFYGHKVISLSFPGDWGTQFGFLIAGYKKWGDKEKLKKAPINEMFNLYVHFLSEAKKNPKLINEGREEFKKLEQGDKENKKIWKWFLEESLKDFERVYNLLGLKIENTIGESYYEPELKNLVRDALENGLARKGNDGAVIIDIPGSDIPEIIQKSDGTTIYTTRELAAIRHRFKKWKATKILYVAANQQTFHLNQVFAAAEILGIAKKEQLGHIKFGMMLGSGGKKFATREGRLIPLEDVLKEAITRAKKIVDRLNPSLPEKEKQKIAKDVGIGAVKFYDLSHNRLTDIVFDWDKMLNLKGFSAPYIQYTYARLNSILEKAKFKKKGSIKLSISHPLEREIITAILCFDEIIKDAAQSYSPNKLAEYLYEFSNALNLFYETLPVLKAEKGKRETRSMVISGARDILETGLGLLGISAPKKM